MGSFRRLSVIVGAALCVLTACGGSGTPGGIGGSLATAKDAGAQAAGSAASASPETAVARTPEPQRIESRISVGSQGRDVDPFKDRDPRITPVVAQVALPPPPAEPAPAFSEKSLSSTIGVPLKVGIARPVSETALNETVAAMLAWTAAPNGGKVAALRFVSSGAQGVRVGLKVRSLPFGALVRFHADGADKVYEIPGQEVLATIQRNLDAGDAQDEARIFWSPNLGGEAITLEIEIPQDASTRAVDIAVPQLSHVLVDIRKPDSIQKIGEGGNCNLDVPCTTTYNELSKSVALMDFIKDGSNYVCTGTLLNDRMSSGIPYFLSAKHCIPTQTVASSLYTLWFYTSSSCNSGSVSPAAARLTTGATLLYASPDVAVGAALQGDTSFMRLNSAPPAGALYAGSSQMGVDMGTSVYGVHHPAGDVQKYSTGMFTGLSRCTSASCLTPSSSNANFLRVHWTQGVTEGGSSGSGLFTRINGRDYLVGQLMGGWASCSAPAEPDFFGRFDAVYDALAPWLGATSGTARVPIYRLYNRNTGTHFYTSSPLERDMAVHKYPQFSYEGVGFYAYAATGTVADTVYRFHNTRTGAHFFTISLAERNAVQSSYPWFSYEGISWYASTAPQGQSAPMHRFYNTRTQTHFYTLSAAERDMVIANYPEYVYEGLGYHAWTSP